MGVYRITTPDGEIYEVEGPDNATDEEVLAVAQGHLNKVAPGKYGKPVRGPDYDPSLTSMASNPLGLGDEAAGLGGAAANALVAPFSGKVDFDPLGSYERARDRERAVQEATRKEMPWASFGAEAVSSLGGLNPAAMPATLGGMIRTGAKGGAVGGGLGGFGYGEGVNGSTLGAIGGSVVGGAFGGALPIAFRMLERPIRAGIDLLRPRNGVGREIVSRAMREDNITAAEAAQRIQQGAENGVPIGLMDLGDNLRGVTAAIGRHPGQGRTLVREAVIPRQQAQNERVRGAIQRDLGPVVNPLQQSDDLIQQARTAAAPHYDEFFSLPGRTSPELQAMLQTPAGRQALQNAQRIAANEQIDPRTIGFDLNDQGEVILTDAISPRTLDYVKRGLDDVLEGYRDKTSGRLVLDESGRAVEGLRQRYVAELDRLYPESYAAARSAYAGPAREREALEMGRKALKASPEEVERMTRNMTDSQLDQFATGYRTAMAESMDRAVDGANKVNTLIGTPRKRQTLETALNGRGDLGRFGRTLADEADANLTYQAINTGSPTAGRILDDALVSDPSIVEDVAGRALRGASNGATGLVAEGIQLFRDINRFGAGATGQRARDEAAALLSNTDLAAWQEAMRERLRDAATIRLRDSNIRRGVGFAGNAGSRAVGGMFGASTRPLEEPY